MNESQDVSSYSSMRHHFAIALVFCTAVMLTIANVTVPTSNIPMFHVYSFNNTPEMDDMWIDFGLYGYCSYHYRTFVGGQLASNPSRYCSSFQVGYDPVPILEDGTYSPHGLFSASEASHLKGLTKPLLIHIFACIFAWVALVAAVLYTRIGPLAESLATLLTCIITIVALGLDTALFVPLRNAVTSQTSAPLASGYWLVVASTITIICALGCLAHEHIRTRGIGRNKGTYRKVEEGTAPSGIALEPLRDAK